MAVRSAKQKYDDRIMLIACWTLVPGFVLKMGEHWHDMSWHFWASAGWLLVSLASAITITLRQQRAAQLEPQS
jgi:hypothetical protein